MILHPTGCPKDLYRHFAHLCLLASLFVPWVVLWGVTAASGQDENSYSEKQAQTIQGTTANRIDRAQGGRPTHQAVGTNKAKTSGVNREGRSAHTYLPWPQTQGTSATPLLAPHAQPPPLQPASLANCARRVRATLLLFLLSNPQCCKSRRLQGFRAFPKRRPRHHGSLRHPLRRGELATDVSRFALADPSL